MALFLNCYVLLISDTFDVIRNVDRCPSSSSNRGREGRSRVLLVDFAPLLKETFKKLAFEWEELDCDVVEFETPEFRYLEQSIQQQQAMQEDDEEEVEEGAANNNQNHGENHFAEIQPNLDNFKFGFPIDFQEQSLSDLIPGLREFLTKN